MNKKTVGRPPMKIEEKNKVVSFTLPPNLVKRLKTQRNKSRFIQDLLIKHWNIK